MRYISLRRIWLIFLAGIVIYSPRIPVLGISTYRIIFPLCAALVFLTGRRMEYDLYHGRMMKSTNLSWLLMALWGSILLIYHGALISNANYVMYDILLVCAAYCFCYYFRMGYGAHLERWFFLFSAILAISGFYESITGNFYHLTHARYAVRTNMLGLLKPNTIFYNINDSAAFMYVALVIAMFYSVKHRGPKGIQLAALLLFLGNIVLTESRGVLLGAAAFCYIYWAFSGKERERWQKVTFSIVLFALSMLWLMSLIDTSDFTFESMGGRGTVWRKSIQTLQNAYYLGNGPGRTVAENAAIQSMTRMNAVHNFFLEIFCDYGFIGGVCLLIWFIGLIVQSIRWKEQSIESLIAFAALIGFIPVSISSSSLIGKVFLLPFFGMIVAELDTVMIVGEDTEDFAEPEEEPVLPQEHKKKEEPLSLLGLKLRWMVFGQSDELKQAMESLLVDNKVQPEMPAAQEPEGIEKPKIRLTEEAARTVQSLLEVWDTKDDEHTKELLLELFGDLE